MVQGLVRRGDLELPGPGQRADPPTPLDASLPGDITCQLWTTGGRLLTAASTAPRLAADVIPDGFSTRTVAGQSWRVYALTDPESDLRILTSKPIERRATLLRDVGLAVTAPFLVLLPVVMALVWLGVRRGLRPLERLRRAVQTRDADSLEPLRADDVPAEVSPLVASLNDLFDRLGEAFQRERRFTADAAHELRTPLAGVKAQLQIVRAADGTTRERALAHAESGLDRMSRLVDQMLMLARLESDTGNDEKEVHCDADAVARAVLGELESMAAVREVDLVLDSPGSGVTAPIPAALLHTALRNLLENAVRHSPDGGHVHLALCDAPLRIAITDEGPGLPGDELARVTERFHRAETGGTGTGLGLYIVTAIAARYGLRLELANRSDGTGLTAVLKQGASSAASPPGPAGS
jgi:signal transduction histidine kinase